MTINPMVNGEGLIFMRMENEWWRLVVIRGRQVPLNTWKRRFQSFNERIFLTRESVMYDKFGTATT
jgi:hypothetical protein